MIFACWGQRTHICIGKILLTFFRWKVHDVCTFEHVICALLQIIQPVILQPAGKICPAGIQFRKHPIEIPVEIPDGNSHSGDFPDKSDIAAERDRHRGRFDIADIRPVFPKPPPYLLYRFGARLSSPALLCSGEELHLMPCVEKRPVHLLRAYRRSGGAGVNIHIGDIQNQHERTPS